MSVTVEFFYDLASPNCYMANKVLPQVLESTGATVAYRPILLGGLFKATSNQAPWITYAPVKPKMAYMMTEMGRFIKKHQLTDYKMNPNFPVNTLLLQRGMIAAEEAGVVAEYVAAGEKMMWEEGLKMDDPEVYAKGFDTHGLDGSALLAKTQDQAIKDKLAANTEEAVKRGAFGAPTFFVGDEMFFGKDRLADLEDEISARS